MGLLGFPNAGKSTFLSVVSNARPEIADYAFTTLTPNLGVADIDDGSLLIADIPGLIEGASEGKGLGDAFLRHVERTSVLLHLIDAYSNDIVHDYQTIRRELEQYSPELIKRPEVIALTKTEGLDEEIVDMQVQALRAIVGTDTEIYAISSTAHKGLKEVLRALRAHVQSVREQESIAENEDTLPVISLSDDEKSFAWHITKDESSDDGSVVYIVTGHRIEKFARRTDFDNFEGVNRLRDIMKKMGITHQLGRSGATGESIIRIGSHEFTLVEQ